MLENKNNKWSVLVEYICESKTIILNKELNRI